MVEKLELKVERIDQDSPKEHKYIICPLKDQKGFVYSATKMGEFLHIEAFLKLEKKGMNVKNPLGGGSTAVNKNVLELYGLSENYGSVPRQVLEYFAQDILAAYQKIWPELTKINCKPYSKKIYGWDEVAETLGIDLKQEED